MKRLSFLLSFLSLSLAAQALEFEFTYLSATNPTPNNAAEILTYTKDGFRVGATFSDNVNVDPNLHSYGAITYQMNSQGVLFGETVIDFKPLVPNSFVTSIAFDPAGRGFGVVSIVPNADQDAVGKIGFYNYRTGQILGTADVGYHPDAVTFSPDGGRIIVSNEGEHPVDFATNPKSVPGSLSVIDVSGILDVNTAPLSQFAGLPSITRDFSNVNISQARLVPGGPMPLFHQIEPEYATVFGNKVYVTLQEANAVGVFNLAPTLAGSDWEGIRSLGTITQKIDGSNVDGPGNTPKASVTSTVRGLPMPDNIAAYEANGVTYYVTANEGDARGDNADVGTVATLKTEGKLDPSLTSGPGDITTNDKLGPLNISRIDGDTNGDGLIDVPTMLGTRSFSIWRASDGALVYDSGSLESIILALDPTTHNINRTLATFDARSTQKGPEPESLTIGAFDGRTMLILGMERQNGLFAFDITNPLAVKFDNDYFNTLTDRATDNNFLLSPESVVWIKAEDSPTGRALILAGHEGTGLANNTDGILVLSSVPEPSTVLFGVCCVSAAALSRRRGRSGGSLVG
ncbi:MAG: choice-of-anchor I family protein [Vicinamibacterales bacterium]